MTAAPSLVNTNYPRVLNTMEMDNLPVGSWIIAHREVKDRADRTTQLFTKTVSKHYPWRGAEPTWAPNLRPDFNLSSSQIAQDYGYAWHLVLPEMPKPKIDHAAEAERLLEWADDPGRRNPELTIACAQVHATLAQLGRTGG